MMEDFIGTYGNNLIVAVVGVGVALLALAIVLWLIRRRGSSSPFIRGGKSRQPRLQVLDAAAVDARRRLVLVRRDNVEHLVMIGGPTDIVIESGIGAIPFMKDVREPQDDMLPAPAVEKAIAPGRTPALLPVREESRAAASIPAAAPAPQPELRPAPAAVQPPAPSPRPAPVPVPAPAPRPAAPSAQPVAASQPAAAPARPAPPPAPAARAVTKEPVAPAVAAPIVPAVTAASLAVEPPVTQSPVPPQASAVAPEPVAIREPVIDQSNAEDFLDAVRDRVLPTFTTAEPIAATASIAKPEPLAPGDNGPVFGDQLTSDFESFLEAEIARNAAATPDVTNDIRPNISLEPTWQPESPQTVSPPVSDGTTESDVQKEMARIFGEMAVTRDK